ncbi:MAG: IS66 family insertion sequence element accessory protein TnpB [Pontibacterium sp.]
MLDSYPNAQTVHLILGVTDMRKSIDGLCALVKYYLDEEPVSERLFVFCNRGWDEAGIKSKSCNGHIMVSGCITNVWKKDASVGPS